MISRTRRGGRWYRGADGGGAGRAALLSLSRPHVQRERGARRPAPPTARQQPLSTGRGWRGRTDGRTGSFSVPQLLVGPGEGTSRAGGARCASHIMWISSTTTTTTTTARRTRAAVSRRHSVVNECVCAQCREEPRVVVETTWTSRGHVESECGVRVRVRVHLREPNVWLGLLVCRECAWRGHGGRVVWWSRRVLSESGWHGKRERVATE